MPSTYPRLSVGADEAAEGEVFAGSDDDAVDGGDGEFEVDDFVVLQGEVGVAVRKRGQTTVSFLYL